MQYLQSVYTEISLVNGTGRPTLSNIVKIQNFLVLSTRHALRILKKVYYAPMITVNVFYLKTPTPRFDHNYYLCRPHTLIRAAFLAGGNAESAPLSGQRFARR